MTDEQEIKVQGMIDNAIRKHNRSASIISLWLGIFFMAAFVDGLLRALGLIEPFMGIDISLMHDIVDKLLTEIQPYIPNMNTGNLNAYTN